MPRALPATWVPCPCPSSGSWEPSGLEEVEVASNPATHLWSSYESGSRSGESLSSSKSLRLRCSLSTPVSRMAMTTPSPVRPVGWTSPPYTSLSRALRALAATSLVGTRRFCISTTTTPSRRQRSNKAETGTRSSTTESRLSGRSNHAPPSSPTQPCASRIARRFAMSSSLGCHAKSTTMATVRRPSGPSMEVEETEEAPSSTLWRRSSIPFPSRSGPYRCHQP